MSMKIEKAAAEREELAAGVLEHFERLVAVTEKYRQQHPPDLEEMRQALAPLVELAQAVRTEYANYQTQFAALLERIAAVDLDALENFPGFGQISPLPAAARAARRTIAAALEDLDDVLEQADAFAKGERSDVQLWDIREIVPRLEHGLWDLPGQIRFLSSRMGNFQSSQPGPPSAQATSGIRTV